MDTRYYSRTGAGKREVGLEIHGDTILGEGKWHRCNGEAKAFILISYITTL